MSAAKLGTAHAMGGLVAYRYSRKRVDAQGNGKTAGGSIPSPLT